MRLTNYDKNAFVRAVMNEVPKIDYQKQLDEVILLDSRLQLEPEVQVVHANPKTRMRLERRLHYAEGRGSNLGGTYIYGFTYSKYTASKEAGTKIIEIGTNADDQADTRATIEEKVRGMINACGTLKKAKELLPEELHKYLPAEREVKSTANVPLVVNLIGDLTALGFPKSAVNANA